MIGLLHSETFRKNLSKWIFMYAAVMCLLTSVITYSKYISSFGGEEDGTRTSKFGVVIEPVATQSSCPDDGTTSGTEEAGTAVLCTTSRPTSLLEYYFTVDVSEIEVNAEVNIRARAGDENYQTSSRKFSNLLIEDINVCTDEACTEFMENKAMIAEDAKSGTITVLVEPHSENSQDVYFFKVSARYDPDKLDKDGDGYIKFSSDELTPVSDEVRIGFSAIQIN